MAIKNIIELIAFGAFKLLFFPLPRRVCLTIGRLLGLAAYYLDGKHRRIALDNLNFAFGTELSRRRLRKIARGSFSHFGTMIAEAFKLPHLGDKSIRKLITIEGEEHIRKALAAGGGALVFSAHLGNWEVASSAVSRLGRLNVVARGLDNRFLESWLAKFRNRLGARVIYKQQAAKHILQSLRHNEIVAILIDQNVLRSEAVFVDFFGRPAATTPALAAFALRTKAPIIPVFCYPERRSAYRLKVGEPVNVDLSGKTEDDVLKITGHCTKMIEGEIRRNPAVWLWFHNRWKTRPSPETSSLREQ